MPVQTYRVDDLGAGSKELADLKLADPPTGGLLCPSLRYNAQVSILGEWHMASALMQLC